MNNEEVQLPSGHKAVLRTPTIGQRDRIFDKGHVNLGELGRLHLGAFNVAAAIECLWDPGTNRKIYHLANSEERLLALPCDDAEARFVDQIGARVLDLLTEAITKGKPSPPVPDVASSSPSPKNSEAGPPTSLPSL